MGKVSKLVRIMITALGQSAVVGALSVSPILAAEVEFIFSGDGVKALGQQTAHVQVGESLKISELTERFSGYETILSNECDGFCVIIKKGSHSISVFYDQDERTISHIEGSCSAGGGIVDQSGAQCGDEIVAVSNMKCEDGESEYCESRALPGLSYIVGDGRKVEGFVVWQTAQRSQGPSFDCEQARTKAEKAICSDVTLSELDVLTEKGYRFAVEVVGKKQAKSIARNALRQRNACGADRDCILKSQTEAIGIYNGLGANLAHATLAAPDHYVPQECVGDNSDGQVTLLRGKDCDVKCLAMASKEASAESAVIVDGMDKTPRQINGKCDAEDGLPGAGGHGTTCFPLKDLVFVTPCDIDKDLY